MNYIYFFQPITWMRYYVLLLIYFQIRFTQHPILVVSCFILLYLFIALSMAPLNYKMVKTKLIGKIIYWIRFCIKVLAFFIAGNYNLYISMIIIFATMVIESILECWLYKNINSIYDINSFELREQIVQKGAYFIIKERKIQKIIYNFGIILCILNMITTPFILYYQLGLNYSFFIALFFSELICLIFITFILKKLY